MEKISVDLCSEEGSGIIYLLASLDCLCGMEVGRNYASSFPFQHHQVLRTIYYMLQPS